MFEMNTPFVVGTLFSMFCAWMLFYALRTYKKALASKGWPSVKGMISELELWGKTEILMAKCKK